MPFHIYHDLSVRAPIQLVFKAVSEPDQLVDWWPQRCAGRPELGASYHFYFAPNYDWCGDVIQFRRNESFHIKMTQADMDWGPTTFGFDLKEIDQGV